MPRPTLAERKRAARDNLTRAAPSTPPSALSTVSAPDTPSADTAPSAPTTPSAGGAGTITVSLTGEQYRDAQAAFLADWDHGGPTTLTAWIETALHTHAARTTNQRTTHVVAASGQPHSFRVTDHTRTLVEDAVAADCAAGHWTSLSAWAAAAITAATDTARQRGPLPTPPDRLPGRLPTRKETRR